MQKVAKQEVGRRCWKAWHYTSFPRYLDLDHKKEGTKLGDITQKHTMIFELTPAKLVNKEEK